jgi:hypothetical protein
MAVSIWAFIFGQTTHICPRKESKCEVSYLPDLGKYETSRLKSLPSFVFLFPPLPFHPLSSHPFSIVSLPFMASDSEPKKFFWDYGCSWVNFTAFLDKISALSCTRFDVGDFEIIPENFFLMETVFRPSLNFTFFTNPSIYQQRT